MKLFTLSTAFCVYQDQRNEICHRHEVQLLRVPVEALDGKPYRPKEPDSV